MLKSLKIILFSIILSISSIPPLSAQDATLSWSPSPSAAVTGYKIYYKPNSTYLPFNGSGAREGRSPVDAGDSLSSTLTGLTDNTTYYFAVTAYNAAGKESPFSNIISVINGKAISLLNPLEATEESIPVTFRWAFSDAAATLNYTLYYGTDAETVLSADTQGAVYTNLSGDNFLFLAVFLMMLLLVCPSQTSHRRWQKVLGVLAGCLAFSACGGGGGSGGGGDGDLNSNRIPTECPSTSDRQVVYAAEEGSSDYYQAFDLEPGTTYYWKVVGVNAAHPQPAYTSAIACFTTESY